jgi:hypothetical protein
MVNFAKEQQRAMRCWSPSCQSTGRDAPGTLQARQDGFSGRAQRQTRLLESQDAMSISEQLVATNLLACKAIGGGWDPRPKCRLPARRVKFVRIPRGSAW